MSHPGSRRTLADEHADLLREVADREERVLGALAAGRWPVAELDDLVGYLRYELIDQAAQEERLLYPLTSGGLHDERVHHLVAEHIRLRDAVDVLATAVGATGQGREPAQLTATLTDLREVLDRHLRTEEDVLSATTESGIENLRRPFRSHDWFTLTEGPTIDLDALPKESAATAVIDRALRMRVGEQVDLHSLERLDPVERLMSRRGMFPEYGWVTLEDGPRQWRATITRRPSGG